MRSAGDELAEACTALEAEVEELKVKYEMYFLGVELREPAKWREETKKKVVRLKEQFTRNTGLRFRLQSLHARFISYERLWLRSAREREEGTYRRDLFKAKLHGRGKAPLPRGTGGAAALAKKPVAPEHHDGEDVDLSDFRDEVPLLTPSPMPLVPPAKPAAPAPAPAPRAPAAPAAPPAKAPVQPAAARPAAAPAPAPAPPAARPAAASPGRLAEAQMRVLYDAYVSAKKRCGEDTSKLTFDAVASSVSKQIPEIMRTHKAKSVEFKVVIKDGKAKLTAVPKG
jgi:hypothetical protein